MPSRNWDKIHCDVIFIRRSHKFIQHLQILLIVKTFAKKGEIREFLMSSSSKKSSKPFSRNAGDWTCPDKSWVVNKIEFFHVCLQKLNFVAAVGTWTSLVVIFVIAVRRQSRKMIPRRRVRLAMLPLKIVVDYSGMEVFMIIFIK